MTERETQQLTTKVAVMGKDIEYIKEKLISMEKASNESHERVTQQIEKFISAAEAKFASKLSEKLVYGCV